MCDSVLLLADAVALTIARLSHVCPRLIFERVKALLCRAPRGTGLISN